MIGIELSQSAVESPGVARLSLCKSGSRRVRDECDEQVLLARPLDRQPMVEALVNGIEIGEQPVVAVRKQLEELGEIARFLGRVHFVDVGEERPLPDRKMIAIDFQDAIGDVADRLQLKDRLAEAGPRLLLATVAPQEAGEAFPADRLSAMKRQIGQKGPRLPPARLDVGTICAVGESKIPPAAQPDACGSCLRGSRGWIPSRHTAPSSSL